MYLRKNAATFRRMGKRNRVVIQTSLSKVAHHRHDPFSGTSKSLAPSLALVDVEEPLVTFESSFDSDKHFIDVPEK